MSKYVSIKEAALTLETSVDSLSVTACMYKKKHKSHPIWYKSSNKVYIDIDYLLTIRDREMGLHHKSIDLYYFINEEMKIKDFTLSEILANGSVIYDKSSSWRDFLRVRLFANPVAKFYDRTSRLSEFHRIASKIKDEHEAKLNSTA